MVRLLDDDEERKSREQKRKGKKLIMTSVLYSWIHKRKLHIKAERREGKEED